MSSSGGGGDAKKPRATEVGDVDAPPGVGDETSSSSTRAAAAAAPASERRRSKSGRKRKWTWKKPKDRPKRPLSSYNFFFQHERRRILALSQPAIGCGETASAGGGTNAGAAVAGPPGFEDMARRIAQRWRTLDEPSRSVFDVLASADKRRHEEEMGAWRRKTSGGNVDRTASSASDTCVGAEVEVNTESKKRHSSASPSAIRAAETAEKRATTTTVAAGVSSVTVPALPPHATLSNTHFAGGEMDFNSTSSLLGGPPALHVPPSRSSLASTGRPAAAGRMTSYVAGNRYSLGAPLQTNAAAAASASPARGQTEAGAAAADAGEIDPDRVANNYERLRRIYSASVRTAPLPLPTQSAPMLMPRQQRGAAAAGGGQRAPLLASAARAGGGAPERRGRHADSDDEFFSLIDSLPKQTSSPEEDDGASDERKAGGGVGVGGEAVGARRASGAGGNMFSGLDYNHWPGDDDRGRGIGVPDVAASVLGGEASGILPQGSLYYGSLRNSTDERGESLRNHAWQNEGNDALFDDSCKFDGANPPPLPLDTTMSAAEARSARGTDNTAVRPGDGGGPGEPEQEGEERQHLFTPRMA